MLSGGEYISAGINLLVAFYLIRFYPRSVSRQFHNRPMPPLFRILATAMPLIGYLLAAGTLLYVLLRQGGVITP